VCLVAVQHGNEGWVSSWRIVSDVKRLLTSSRREAPGARGSPHTSTTEGDGGQHSGGAGAVHDRTRQSGYYTQRHMQAAVRLEWRS
jgi:hypothetical protein